MNNKKLLMVGLGLVSVGLVSGCGPRNVCLYGVPEELATTYVDPESENSEESVEEPAESEETSETEITETVPEEIEGSVKVNMNYCLYGCPISDETKKTISEAEKYSETESTITIK